MVIALASACGGGGGGNGGTTQPPGGGATPVLTSIAVSGSSTSVAVSSTLQLTALPKDQFGSAFTAAITWTSSNRTVADVDVSGLVYGINAGTATLTAQSGAVSSGAPITVTAGGSFTLQRTVQMPANPFSFSPAQTDILVTGTVSFEFAVDDHNVIFTSGSGSGKPADITPPVHSTTVTRQFNTQGAFPFVCTLHPGMSGTVVVH
jgi:plastocyanin